MRVADDVVLYNYEWMSFRGLRLGDEHTEVDEQYRYLGLLLKLKIPLLLFGSVRGGRKERGNLVRRSENKLTQTD